MAKGPKLRISFLNSIQICRPNDPSTLVKDPLPTLTYTHSQNSTTYDLSFPSFQYPPSSSDNFSTKCQVSSSKITHYEPESCVVRDTRYELRTRVHSRTKREDTEKFKGSTSSSTDLNEGAPTQKKEKTVIMKPKARGKTSVDNLSPSSTSSSSFNSSCSNQLKGEPLDRSENSSRQRSVRTRRFKRYGSKDWSDEGTPKVEPNEPIKEHRQENKSFVVLKRSVDPYKDFKKSMLEMILERQIFEPRDLEQLLMSFLSLNSRVHHKAILKAFSEIWKEVFCGTFN